MFALIFGLMIALGGAAAGTEETGSRNDSAGGGALLAGPVVEVAAPARTLVHFGADGRLLTLETREEIAAIELLDFTGPEREAVDRYIRSRLVDVTAGGIRRIPLLLELQEAIASGSDGRIDEVLGRYAVHRDIWNSNPEEVLRAALPERLRDQYARLISEYREAWIAEHSSMADRQVLLARLERENRIAEIQKPAEASAERARERFEKISRRLDLTTEQEGKLQTLLQQFATNSNFNPRPRDRLKLLADMFGVLTWKQRLELRSYLLEERGGERFRPPRDAPKATGMVAGIPLMLWAIRRKRPRAGRNVSL
ncbi:MAG: hypothetical protein U0573_05485 [Phycisphaerales bacterium]|nr:hypothetical protein [Planctomycetota bacterium]